MGLEDRRRQQPGRQAGSKLEERADQVREICHAIRDDNPPG